MKREKGFGLLEVVIALLILAIGLLGVAGMITVGVRTNAEAARLTEAYQVGQGELERLKDVPWNMITTGSHSREMRGIIFTSSWSVVSTVGKIKDINMAVTWDGGIQPNGLVKKHQIDLRTKFAK